MSFKIICLSALIAFLILNIILFVKNIIIHKHRMKWLSIILYYELRCLQEGIHPRVSCDDLKDYQDVLYEDLLKGFRFTDQMELVKMRMIVEDFQEMELRRSKHGR